MRKKLKMNDLTIFEKELKIKVEEENYGDYRVFLRHATCVRELKRKFKPENIMMKFFPEK